MKAYLFNAINRYKKFSEELDVQTILCDKSWWVFNDSNEKEVYIFNTDGTLIISVSGRVTNATWQYISANKSIVISGNNQSYMVHPVLYDKVVFALQVDGTKDCIFLIDENNINSFKPKNLAELTSYFNRREEKYIQQQRIEQQEIQKAIREQKEESEQQLREEARQIKMRLQKGAESKVNKLRILFIIVFSISIPLFIFPSMDETFLTMNINNIFIKSIIMVLSLTIILFLFVKTANKLECYIYRRKLEIWKRKHPNNEVTLYMI